VSKEPSPTDTHITTHILLSFSPPPQGGSSMAAVLIIDGGAHIPEAAVAPEADPGHHGEGDKDKHLETKLLFIVLVLWCTAAF